MRILILSQWYVPEPVLLLQELAQTLLGRGHGVTVLTGFPNYPSGRLYPGYRTRLLQRETIAGVSIVRVPLYPDHSRSGFRRALNYLSFAISAALLGWWSVSRPDVIFVYHPPLTVGVPAFVLSRLWRVPFVYQIQDMWPETLSATGMVRNRHILGIVGRIATWVYSKAESICVISHGFRASLISKGVPPEKINVISNWVDTTTYYPAQRDSSFAEGLGLAGRFNVIFAGNIGEAQGLETVVEAAAMLSELEKLQFVFVGDGVALPRLKQAVRERRLLNVSFLDPQPSKNMPRMYALADVLLVHLRDDPLFRMTIPHKIFAYMACGKPVLAAVAGDAAEIVSKAGAGLICPPQDPHALALTVQRICDMTEMEREKMGEAGLVAARTKYSREILAGEIESLLLSAVKGKH